MQTITPTKGLTRQLVGSIITFLAVSADTNGAFALFDARVAPQTGAPFHRHSDDEAFLVLEGTFQFRMEDKYLHLGSGEFIFIPKETRHTYLNSSADKE
nr:cupin domain-containing protein [Ktedonobacteraceae bacterium]